MDATSKPVVHIVHAVDTEGPLDENLEATFTRLEQIYGVKVAPTPDNLSIIQEGRGKRFGLSDHAAESARTTFSRENLAYNRTWGEIDSVMEDFFSPKFRGRVRDSRGEPWKATWFCMDHGDLDSNPRNKQLGYGEIHQYYSNLIARYGVKDEIQFHFHPMSVGGNALSAATSYNNNSPQFVLELAKRILKFEWFPSCYRPGFHSIRPDSNLFIEQWFPFDYSNQSYDDDENQPDLARGRFGDWRNATRSWAGYRPSVRNYQLPGELNRVIFRCLNAGTRHRLLRKSHIIEAFSEARVNGVSVLAFTDHDWRDIRLDVDNFLRELSEVAGSFKDVDFHFSGAEEAGIAARGNPKEKPELHISIEGNQALIRLLKGSIHGGQPFLAVEMIDGTVIHDNLDLINSDEGWSYTFDASTLSLEAVAKIAVGASSSGGSTAIVKKKGIHF